MASDAKPGKPPRVLCFGRFYDEIPGGMQRHVEHLFAALKGQVDFVHLVPSRDRHGAAFRLQGFPVVRTPSLNLDGSLALSPGLIREARKLHRRYQFDLIHLHFPDPMSHLASLTLPPSIPRLITWHADIIRQKTLLKFYDPLLRRTLGSCAAIIAPTAAHISASAYLRKLEGDPRLHVVPFGFDLADVSKPHPMATDIANRHPGRRVFALGRHVYYKGFDILLEAMTRLPADIQLLLGGVGPLTESLQRQALQLGLADRVHFLGRIEDVDLPAYYQAGDVFCLPATSRAEAFGIVQLEAMANARPVVSTRLGNGVDFVNLDGVTGLTVEPNDARALADALVRLLDDPALRHEQGRAGLERAFGEFSSETMARRTLAVYRQALTADQI